jgi:hypothetical protein
MSAGATLAQCVWALANLPAARAFSRALNRPDEVQHDWLRAQVARDHATAFGREHGFEAIRDYDDFARRVPLRAWCDFAPWIQRIQHGETRVLSAAKITHLASSSGSSGARKLIPFTADLQRGFSAVVGAWMTDLIRLEPALLTGSAYWSISPLSPAAADEISAVPIGFADDAEYLGGAQAWLVRQAMTAPATLRHETDMERFWVKTLVAILARRDLRLISVWHPSFFNLLLEAASRHWAEICAQVAELNHKRARELTRLGAENWAHWWPRLRVISCWGEQAAAAGLAEIARSFPNVRVQAKGLLATEAAITLPWQGRLPLAVTAHFFEFIAESGDIRRAHELERGRTYEVVVSNGGGLWRYRLGDVVECTGHLAKTPTLRFLGRAGNVSDLRGEKLHETFVAEVLRGLWPHDEPRVAWLEAETDGAGYKLCLTTEPDRELEKRLEAALSENPHYALARKLGQLRSVRVERVAGGQDLSANSTAKKSGRLGDVKPKVLVGPQRKP